MKHYELLYIIPLKVGQDDGSEIQEKVHNFLVSEGAKITREENLGKRKLAYAIKHVRHGIYVVIEFDLEPVQLPKIQAWLRLSSDILRSQIVAKKLLSPEQLARERALQEKLMKKQIQAASTTKTDTVTPDESSIGPTTELADLDKKLEEILEQEIVK